MPRKVVIAVDPSPVSLDALRWASKSLCNKDDELHLISVLESGLANDVVGESAADSSPDCKPDPIALQKTQDLLQVRPGPLRAAAVCSDCRCAVHVACPPGPVSACMPCH
jgi:hypothetical protein